MGGAAADTATVEMTVVEAAVEVAGLIVEVTPEGEYKVQFDGVEEVVTDKGYYSNEVVRTFAENGIEDLYCRTGAGRAQLGNKPAEQEAVYANRRRIRGARGKKLQAQRGERIERNFAHQFDTGGMDRLYVRGLVNVHKKLLLQAAACNLALLLRSWYGAGKPRAAHDRIIEAAFAILAFMGVVEGLYRRSGRETSEIGVTLAD